VLGGVKEHIRDLAEALMDLGHEVSVISAVVDELLPGHVVPAGRSGSLQRRGAVTARLPGRSGCQVALSEGLKCLSQTSHRIGLSACR
jgi:hypothetical protein